LTGLEAGKNWSYEPISQLPSLQTWLVGFGDKLSPKPTWIL